MSKLSFFPFKFQSGKLELKVELVGAQGSVVDQDRILAYALEGQSINLNVTVNADEFVYSKTLPVEEQASRPAELILVLRSSRGRNRRRIPIPPTGTSITLHRDEWLGTVQVQAFLVRTTTNPAQGAGFARDRGAMLADSKTVEILFDEPPVPPIGGLINLRWENFAESQRESLKNQPESLFALDDLTDPPVLYLNSGLEGATATLESKANSGLRARMRDVAYATITHQVWTSLLTTSLITLAERLDDSEDEVALAELMAWQRAALHEWSPRLYPALGKEDALSALCQELRRTSWEREILLRRLPEALQRFVETGAKFVRAAKEV